MLDVTGKPNRRRPLNRCYPPRSPDVARINRPGLHHTIAVPCESDANASVHSDRLEDLAFDEVFFKRNLKSLC